MNDRRLSAEGPRELTLYVTDRCNAVCVFDGNPCKRQADSGVEHSGEMTAAWVDSLLERLPHVESCCIAGFGEPLLVHDLGGIVEVLARRKIYVGVITNGIRLMERLDELTAMPIGDISISLNATTPEWHEEVFGVRKFEHVLAGASELARRRRPEARFSFVVTRKSAERIADMIDVAVRCGVEFVVLHNVLPHAGPTNPGFLASVIREDSTEALAAIEAAKRHTRADVVKVWPVPLPRPPVSRCVSPFRTIGVDAKGCVTACRRIEEPKPEYGSVFDEGFWQNPHYEGYRRGLTNLDEMPPTCRACFGSVVG